MDPKTPKAQTFVRGEVIVPTDKGIEVKKETTPKIYKHEKEILQSLKQNSPPSFQEVRLLVYHTIQNLSFFIHGIQL